MYICEDESERELTQKALLKRKEAMGVKHLNQAAVALEPWMVLLV